VALWDAALGRIKGKGQWHMALSGVTEITAAPVASRRSAQKVARIFKYLYPDEVMKFVRQRSQRLSWLLYREDTFLLVILKMFLIFLNDDHNNPRTPTFLV
jgi:hypothetical protein